MQPLPTTSVHDTPGIPQWPDPASQSGHAARSMRWRAVLYEPMIIRDSLNQHVTAAEVLLSRDQVRAAVSEADGSGGDSPHPLREGGPFQFWHRSFRYCASASLNGVKMKLLRDGTFEVDLKAGRNSAFDCGD